MKCDNCSKCCENIYLPFIASPDEKEWLEYHDIEVIENSVGEFIKINNKCSKLVDGRCSIYEKRPDICRKYECKNNKDFI